MPWVRGGLAWVVVSIGTIALHARTVEEKRTILFLGDSLTAGLGVDLEESYPALIQEMLDAAGLPFRSVNAGQSGETSAGGLRRLNWLLRQEIEILVVALGGNDGLRGLDPLTTESNLQAILDRMHEESPHTVVMIAGMRAPPNMGSDYTRAFDRVFPGLTSRTRALLIPFLLEDVAAVPELSQADGIHPNREGHERIAQYVWRYLEPVLLARMNSLSNP